MNTPVALLFDFNHQSFGCGRFLLELAGFSVVSVDELAEMVNLAICQQQTDQPFALLLLDNLPPAELMQAIRLLQRAEVALPILLVNRELYPSEYRPYALAEFGADIFFCHPEQIGAAAKVIAAATMHLPTYTDTRIPWYPEAP